MKPFLINEKHLSQIPALQLLIGLGFVYRSFYGMRISKGGERCLTPFSSADALERR